MSSPLSLLQIPALADVGLRADFRLVQSTNPAANVEWSYTVPAGHHMRLVSVSVECVQGNTQTPRPYLVIDDGTAANVIFKAPGASAVQSADITSQYTWAPGLTLTAAAALVVNAAPIPDNLILPPGYTVRSETVGKGANTNYGVASLFVVDFTS